MSQHSPGPWVIAPAAFGGLYVVGSDGEVVATVDCGNSRDEDASLIAASPDMLAVCERLIRAYDGCDDIYEVVSAARAAIVRAAV